MTPDGENYLKEQVTVYLRHFRNASRWWSVCFYGFTFGAAVLSAVAGLLPQLDADLKNVATVLAVTSSLFTTMIAIGRFEAKWRANRQARASLEQLQIDVGTGGEPERVATRFKEVIGRQSSAITGGDHRQ